MSEERKKFFKVWRGKKKCKCRISGVQKKKEIERKKKKKIPRKKIKVFFENFAKFVFTGWVFSVERKCFSSSRKKKFWVCVTLLVGHHVD